MSRRAILGLLAAGCLPARAAWAAIAAEPGSLFPQMVTLTVAGPAGGQLDSASAALLADLQGHLPPGTRLGRTTIGGVDGVTGANQFAVQAAPDGAAALLVPGAASSAWLVGDSRVHFDPSHWLTVLARVGPTIVAGRGAIAPGTRLRVATGGPASPALAALLALDLLGANVAPVGGLADDAAAAAALADGQVDAILLQSTETLATLRGGAPWFSFGLPSTVAGQPDAREPATPDLPTLAEYAATLGRALPATTRAQAWRCAASAAQLRYALVLPSLTPPSAVALWRQAGSTIDSSEPGVIHAAATAALMQSLVPDGTALLDLRGWLARRFGWQPG